MTDRNGQYGCNRGFGGALGYGDRLQATQQSEKPLGGMVCLIEIEPPFAILQGNGWILFVHRSGTKGHEITDIVEIIAKSQLDGGTA